MSVMTVTIEAACNYLVMTIMISTVKSHYLSSLCKDQEAT